MAGRKESPETKFVVNPLLRWFKNQNAHWRCRTPRHPTAETGWDIEACRKNRDLLIEAKYIQKSFINSFNGLVTAPLTYRQQKSMKSKYRSWCYTLNLGGKSIFDNFTLACRNCNAKKSDILVEDFCKRQGKPVPPIVKNLLESQSKQKKLSGNKRGATITQ